MGKPEDNIQENIELALSCGCAIVSVAYRLAPEFPYPAALDDCHAVLAWLYHNAALLQIDKTRIAIKGESAGGGLAASLALRARDEGLYSIVLLILIAPMLEYPMDQIKRKSNPFSGEFIWTKGSNIFAWKAYLGNLYGQVDIPTYAAAGNSCSLNGLPPTFLAVGSLDLFLEEDVDFALRLNQSGVSAEIHVYPGAYHSFQRAGDTSFLKRLKHDYRAAVRNSFCNGDIKDDR
ncbi:Esterase/lipase/thioesterase [Variovorax sp. WDL1]|nr:Esterase/lipase/thioesterase [Variovorax sp. WDL1]